MYHDLAWPKKGDKSFVSANDESSFSLDSRATYTPLNPEAFGIGAEMILERCLEADVFRFTDELFFPVAYLYRHGLELHLKNIVCTGVRMGFFERGDVDEALANHSLARLWTQAKKLLIDRWPTADQGPLNATEAIVNEWHSADPNGQAFRYDRDKSGRWYHHDRLPQVIDRHQLRQTMEGVFNFLEATSSCLRDDLSDMLQTAREDR